MMHRHNSLFIGKYEDIEIVGFKSQFTFAYGEIENEHFMEVEKGIGINPEAKFEGIRKNNFFGTYLTGPILILNPLLMKKLLEILGVKEPKIALEEDCMAAYKARLEEFKKVSFEK